MRLRVPAGWTADPAEVRLSVAGAGETATAGFRLTAPRDATPGRTVVTAEVDLGDDWLGEAAETLLEVVAPMTSDALHIVGGTVIDPASGRHDLGDIRIEAGRIAAVGPDAVPADAVDVIDATGLLVVPGLIDLHVHVYPGVADLSVEADRACLGRGVTTVVDGGSSGANTFAGFRKLAAEPSRCRVLAFLNIGATGQIDTHLGELHDLRFVDPVRAIAVAEANRDLIVGFKVRVSETLSGSNGIAALERALEAGEATSLARDGPRRRHAVRARGGRRSASSRRRRDAFVHRLASGDDPGRRRAGRGGRP